MRWWPRPLPIVAGAVLLWALPAPAASQASMDAGGWEASGTTGELAYLSFNALTGALTAGISAKIRGRDFSDAAVRGAMGGALMYGGKRLVGSDVEFGGLLGRQVSATGTSIIRNAGEGRASLERVILPLGVIRLHVNLADVRVEAARLNVSELAALAWAASRDELTIDWRATLESGAPVFDAWDYQIDNGGRAVNGLMANGVVLLSGVRSRDRPTVLRHEVVHVLQHDFLMEAISSPVESWLLQRLPGGRTVARVLDPGLLGQGLLHLSTDALEAEARFFERR